MEEIILTTENFKTEVLESDVPVLVDFWATWCGPCMMLAPTIKEIAEESDGSYKVGKVNVDEQPVLAAMYQVNVIPTLVIVKDGNVKTVMRGGSPKQEIKALLR